MKKLISIFSALLAVTTAAHASQQVNPAFCDRVDMLRLEAQNNPEVYAKIQQTLIEIISLTGSYLQKTSIDPNDPLSVTNGNHGEGACGIASMNSIDTLVEASKIRGLYLTIPAMKGLDANWMKTFLPEIDKALIESLKYSSAFSELCKANQQTFATGQVLYSAKLNMFHIAKLTEIVRKNIEAPYVYSCQL